MKNTLSCTYFTKILYRIRLFVFLVLQIPAFHVPCFTDSGFLCSWFYRFRLFMFRVLQIPAFYVPGFTDSGFSCSWFLQIPAFHVPGFTDSGFSCSFFSRSLFRSSSVPRFPVPCFTDSRMITHTFTNINILPVQMSFRWRQDQLMLHSQQDGKVLQKVARLLKMKAVQPTFLF